MSGALELSVDVLGELLRAVKLPDGGGLNPPFVASDAGFAASLGGISGTIAYQVFVDRVTVDGVANDNEVLLSFDFSRSSMGLTGFGSVPQVGGLGGRVVARVPIEFRVPHGGNSVTQLHVCLSRMQVDEPRWDAKTLKDLPDSTSIARALVGSLEHWGRAVNDLAVGPVLPLVRTRPCVGFLEVARHPTARFLASPSRLRIDLDYVTDGRAPVPDSRPLFSPRPSAAGAALTRDGFHDALKRQIIMTAVRRHVAAQERRRLRWLEAGKYLIIPEGTTREAMIERDVQAFLGSRAGREAVAAQTPRPIGWGRMRRDSAEVTLFVSELELDLADGRLVGSAVGEASLSGFDITSRIRFSASPVLTPDGEIALEEVWVSDPETSAVHDGVLGDVVRLAELPIRLIFGTTIYELFDELIAGAAELIAGDEIDEVVRDKVGVTQSLGLPSELMLTEITVTDRQISASGRWATAKKRGDPPRQSISIRTDLERSGARLIDGEGKKYYHRWEEVWLSCARGVGYLHATEPGQGQRVKYRMATYSSTLSAHVELQNVPWPLREARWSMRIGPKAPKGRSTHNLPMSSTFDLSTGVVPVNGHVWDPQPLMGGTEEEVTFSVTVSEPEVGSIEISFPEASKSLRCRLVVEVVDATGGVWNANVLREVENRDLVFGEGEEDIVDKMETECLETSETIVAAELDVGRKDPLETVWYPGDEYAGQVEFETLRLLADSVRRVDSAPGIERALDLSRVLRKRHR